MLPLLLNVQVPRPVPFLILEHGDQHLHEGPHREVSAFEYGLDLILEGVQKIHAAET